VTLFRLAVRLGRVGAVVAGLIGVAGAIAQPYAFAQLRGDTPADRAVFAQQMEILARQLTYILPVPHELGTMAGWIEWRAIGTVEIVVAVWALLAATGAGRGDEERGLVEHWLAQGVSRGRYILSRILAFALLAAAVSVVTVGAAGLGSLAASDPVPPVPLILQGVAILGIVLCCYAIALLAAQLVITRRGGAMLGGTILLGLYLIDVVARTGGAEAVRLVSPFWLYDEQHPLTNGGTLDVAKAVALYLAAAALTAVAVTAFARRDLGGVPFGRTPREAVGTAAPSRDPLLRIPVVALLDQQRSAILVWTLITAVLGVFFLSFTRTLVDTMLATPSFRVYMERAGLGSYTAFIGVTWFSTLILLLSIFAIVAASGWAADDQEGRLEVVLAQPVSRDRIVLERLAALLAAAAIVLAGAFVALVVGAQEADITLDAGRVALGTVLALTVVLAFGGLGAAGVSWRPRLTILALGAVAIVSFFVLELGPLFGWPSWVSDLSVYALYGNPVSGTVDWARQAALVAIGVVGTVLALAAMRRRDIGA
jgi:ABC-2 type transport system permease protein